MTEFRAWPKTPRLFRDITVTEKLDGTNAAIHFIANTGPMEGTFSVTVQSRNRIIKPGDDNYGFAHWVHTYASELFALLGPGLHFGEWWGKGIQRNYGIDSRRFSLFNTDVHRGVNTFVGGVLVQPVPVLWRGTFREDKIRECLTDLQEGGSEAAPGFMNPEGICVFHHASRNVFKVTLDANDAGKWEV